MTRTLFTGVFCPTGKLFAEGIPLVRRNPSWLGELSSERHAFYGVDTVLLIEILLSDVMPISRVFRRTIWSNVFVMCVMCVGGASQAIAFPVNTRQWGNALAIWLGINPSDLFLYIFLPPMLLDAAIRISFFHFRKVWVHSSMDSWSWRCAHITTCWNISA